MRLHSTYALCNIHNSLDELREIWYSINKRKDVLRLGDGKRFTMNMTAKVFSLGLNLLISFFLTPFIIRHVGTESYGYVGLAHDFVDCARIATVALHSMALRYITVCLHRGDEAAANRYFSSVMIVNILLCVVLLVPFGGVLLLLERLFDISKTILTDVTLLWGFVFLNFFITIAGAGYAVALFAKNRIDKESFRSAESIAIRALFLFICYTFFTPKVFYVGISYCVLTVYVLISNVYYTKKYLPNLKIRRAFFDKGAVKELLCSGSWNCLTKIATILTTGLDLLLVNIFVGSRQMGVVSLSKTIPTTVLSVFVILSGVFLPKLTEAFSKKDGEGMVKNAVFSVKLLGLFAAVPLVVLGVFGEEFYRLWTPTEDARFLWLLSLAACLPYVVSLASQNLWNLFTVTNRVKVSSIGFLGAAVVSLSAVLISMAFVRDPMLRIFLIVGTSAVCNFLLTVTFLPWQAAKCMDISPKRLLTPMIKAFLFTLGLGAVFAIVGWIVPVHSWAGLIVMVSAVCVCGAGFGFVLLFEKEEKNVLWKKIRH